MLIIWISFKTLFDKPNVMVNLRIWISKKFWKTLGWVLVSVCRVFHPHTLPCSKCLVLEHTAFPAKSVTWILYSHFNLQIQPLKEICSEKCWYLAVHYNVPNNINLKLSYSETPGLSQEVWTFQSLWNYSGQLASS